MPLPHAGSPLARSPRIWACAPVGLAALALAAGCAKTQPEAPRIDPAAEAVVDAAISRFEASAQVTATESAIAAALRDAIQENLGPLQLLTGLAPDDQRSLAGVVRRRLQEATRAIVADNDRLRRVRDLLVSEWRTCSDVRLSQAKLADATERDARKAQQTALVLGTENRWFWLSGLIAVASLFVIFALDRRHEIRRYLNGGSARDLGLGRILVVAFAAMATVTAALFFASDGLLVDLLGGGSAGMQLTRIEQQQAEDDAESARKAADLQATRTDLASKKSSLETRIAPLVPADMAGPLLDDWWAFWQAATENRGLKDEIAAIADRFSKDKQDVDPAGADSLAAGINANRKTAASWRRGANLIAGFIGVSLLSLVAGGFAWYLRGVSRRTRDLAQTCPLCLSKGKLATDDQQPETTRCHNVVSDKTGRTCEFTFPQALRPLKKLTFATLGERSAGKTLWTAMSYHLSMKGNYPHEHLMCQSIENNASQEYDRKVDDILSHQDVSVTNPHRLPHPLVMKLRHSDRLGTTDIMLNVLDFAGEVYTGFGTTRPSDQQELAVRANGFLLFIDPDHRMRDADAKRIDGTFEPFTKQIKHLSNFGQQVEAFAQLSQCPVAVCVPKIDLLSRQTYATGGDGDPVCDFYKSLAGVGWGMDLQSIASRSALVAALTELLWQNWPIEQEIDRIFGGRYMFFPCTPVGLDGMGKNWMDGDQPVSPLGILHPLMWLLHMNGYPVLPRTSQA